MQESADSIFTVKRVTAEDTGWCLSWYVGTKLSRNEFSESAWDQSKCDVGTEEHSEQIVPEVFLQMAVSSFKYNDAASDTIGKLRDT